MSNKPLNKTQIISSHLTEGGVFTKFFNRKMRRQLQGYRMPNTGNRKITKARKKTYMFVREPKKEILLKSGRIKKVPGKVIKLIRMMNLRRI